MIPGTLQRVHEDLESRGYAIATSKALGLPAEADVIAALSPSLAPDPRGPGKEHARDVIRFGRVEGCWPSLTECASIAHGGTDDFSRFRLLEAPQARIDPYRSVPLANALLSLIPLDLRRESGSLSADYFRYSPGAGSSAHQDKFGDMVIIWVLDRNGSGAESFLTTLDGKDVMRGPLAAGTVLVFRDEMFLHGVTPLASGHRDVLIFISLLEEGVR